MSSNRGFFCRAHNRRLIYLLILASFALYEAVTSDFERRTFEFYTLETGKSAVEERGFRRASSRELAIRRYVEETLLGPVSPQSAPLFFRDARLRSLLFRDGAVYADLSEAAALPPLEGGEPLRSLETLERGIRRNFPYVKNVYFFIEGNEVARRKRLEMISGNMRKNGKNVEKGVDKLPATRITLI